jgi:hypothetical protein
MSYFVCLISLALLVRNEMVKKNIYERKEINTTWLIFTFNCVDYELHVKDFRKQHRKRWPVSVRTKM